MQALMTDLGLTENTDLTFSLIFFLKPVFFGFICGFSWICECLWHSLFLKSI